MLDSKVISNNHSGPLSYICILIMSTALVLFLVTIIIYAEAKQKLDSGGDVSKIISFNCLNDVCIYQLIILDTYDLCTMILHNHPILSLNETIRVEKKFTFKEKNCILFSCDNNSCEYETSFKIAMICLTIFICGIVIKLYARW